MDFATMNLALFKTFFLHFYIAVITWAKKTLAVKVIKEFLMKLSDTEKTFNIFLIFIHSDPYPGKLISPLGYIFFTFSC